MIGSNWPLKGIRRRSYPGAHDKLEKSRVAAGSCTCPAWWSQGRRLRRPLCRNRLRGAGQIMCRAWSRVAEAALPTWTTPGRRSACVTANAASAFDRTATAGRLVVLRLKVTVKSQGRRLPDAGPGSRRPLQITVGAPLLAQTNGLKGAFDRDQSTTLTTTFPRYSPAILRFKVRRAFSRPSTTVSSLSRAP